MVEGKWHCYHGTNQFFRMQKLAQALEKLDDAPRVAAEYVEVFLGDSTCERVDSY